MPREPPAEKLPPLASNPPAPGVCPPCVCPAGLDVPPAAGVAGCWPPQPTKASVSNTKLAGMAFSIRNLDFRGVELMPGIIPFDPGFEDHREDSTF